MSPTITARRHGFEWTPNAQNSKHTQKRNRANFIEEPFKSGVPKIYPFHLKNWFWMQAKALAIKTIEKKAMEYGPIFNRSNPEDLAASKIQSFKWNGYSQRGCRTIKYSA